jgi:hypothetical protein
MACARLGMGALLGGGHVFGNLLDVNRLSRSAPALAPVGNAVLTARS